MSYQTEAIAIMFSDFKSHLSTLFTNILASSYVIGRTVVKQLTRFQLK